MTDLEAVEVSASQLSDSDIDSLIAAYTIVAADEAKPTPIRWWYGSLARQLTSVAEWRSSVIEHMTVDVARGIDGCGDDVDRR